MKQVIGPVMLGIGTVLVSSMFAVLKSLEHVDPIIRASWRLQTTFLALSLPSVLSIYLSQVTSAKEASRASSLLPPLATVWSGCGYALYNVGLCIALAKTSLLRASILSQCAPLFIVVHKIMQNQCCQSGTGGVHWKHILGVVLTLVGTGVFISSTTKEDQNLNAELDGGKSQFVGDLAAAAASLGYATYISCGQQARRSVPVYIHLPGCVLVAAIIVSIICFMTMDTSFDVSQLSSTDDFCAGMLGWTCPEYLPRSTYLGVVCGAIAVGLINGSLNLVTALQAAAANSAEPIAASLIGIAFFSEPFPDAMAILAAGIIVLAMLLCSADDGKSTKTIRNSAETLSTRSKNNTRKTTWSFSGVEYVLVRGLFALLLTEALLMYHVSDNLPELQTNTP